MLRASRVRHRLLVGGMTDAEKRDVRAGLASGEVDLAIREEDAAIRITVADRGPGIPEVEREKVFTPFYRLEGSRSRETGGTGLGLAIARAAIRRHSGDITFEDRDGGGLVAAILLPKPKSAV